MHKLIVILATLTLAASAAAQMSDRADLEAAARANVMGIEPAKSPLSLIDLSRLHWSHSYSLSYLSGGGQSASVGMLTTSMFYEFSPKLSLLLNVGVAHNAGALWGEGVSDATVLPGFMLDYHPSESFRMTVGMQSYTGGWYGPYYRRGSLFGPGSWWNRY
ncbi:MAG TPA: hypothetical protein PK186_08970 [candidate division Zixibacteria bacterium]|nr:hypothetical protein [candidate division Zixibacteria bacterium]MDD4916367.1 hypothetical protein [candidate division Zixibacteria bacterium]MDM7972827.1 hypothetical protein [candidate division Zixibacteria bacterium]HOD66603.1 hypothetical protein [candidate division Zixibacteria bacterium]HPM37672.1 hypothetical protein [candidate division Zixibacteria bacterium]